MKSRFFVFLFLIASSIQAQFVKHKALNCEVLIDVNYKGYINIYDINGKIIKKLKHNFKEEDFVTLTIIGKNDSMYNVTAYYCIKGGVIKGWVKKNTPQIGTYSRGYSSAVTLYSKPDKYSKIQSTIKEYSPKLMHIKDCENNWVYVSVIIAHKKYEGWLSPDNQCANPYTTCN
jgi:hypothetical protein